MIHTILALFLIYKFPLKKASIYSSTTPPTTAMTPANKALRDVAARTALLLGPSVLAGLEAPGAVVAPGEAGPSFSAPAVMVTGITELE